MTSARITQLPLQALVEADADPQITQLPTQVLADAESDATISQAGLLVMGSPPCPARIMHMPVQVLVDVEIGAHILQMPVQVLAYGVDCLSYLAQCWRIERRDGTVHTFTNHDTAITFNDEIYYPCGSINPSAYQASGQMGEVGNTSLLGLLALGEDDAGITADSINAGLLDAAEVTIWEVPWRGSERPFPLLKGYIGKISQKNINYEAEIITLSGLLNNKSLLETYTPNCRFELGDSRCTVNLPDFTETGEVTELAAGSTRLQSKKRQFFDSSRTEDANYWANGILTWTSGNNSGYSSEVASSSDAGSIILWNVMPNEIELGDEYTIIAGCDKRKQTCIDKFSNFENFGGFPDIPGNDKILQTPDAKQ